MVFVCGFYASDTSCMVRYFSFTVKTCGGGEWGMWGLGRGRGGRDLVALVGGC